MTNVDDVHLLQLFIEREDDPVDVRLRAVQELPEFWVLWSYGAAWGWWASVVIETARPLNQSMAAEAVWAWVK